MIPNEKIFKEIFLKRWLTLISFIKKPFFRPKMTLKRLIKYLKKIGWNCKLVHKIIPNKGIVEAISCRIKAKSSVFDLNIFFHIDYLDFLIIDYIKIPTNIKSDFFESLPILETSIGELKFYPKSKGIDLGLIYPLISDPITFSQLYQCLLTLFKTADEFYPQIEREIHQFGGKK